MPEIEGARESSTRENAGMLPMQAPEEPKETRILRWIALGPHGLRSGWLVMGFALIYFIATGVFTVIGAKVLRLSLENALSGFGPATAGLLETASFLALLVAMLLGALAARRNLLDYYLRSRYWVAQFAVGVILGVAALSLLIAALWAGGWIHVTGGDLQGPQVFRFAMAWAGVFLLTGLTEEGTNRCFLLGTLSRGVNFWWSSGSVAFICLAAAANAHGNGTEGIYAAALLGTAGCLVLHLRRSEGLGFWCGAWLTSVAFGYLHTFNRGESAIGIFGTALIGFAFCVSIRALGSAWWAIGFHAGWDWAQTFLFGTPDSGLAPKDHWLTSLPAGQDLWSGGSAGPEGSLLILPLIALLMVGLALVAKVRNRQMELAATNLS